MLLNTFFRLCLLRANPQDLPPSRALFGAMLIVHFGADVAVLATNYPLLRAVEAAVIDTLLLVALVHSLLLLRGLSARALQTLTALLAVGALFTLGTSSLVALTTALIPAWATLLACIVWHVAVFAHVARQALGIPLPAAVALAIGYDLLSLLVGAATLGPPGAAGDTPA